MSQSKPYLDLVSALEACLSTQCGLTSVDNHHLRPRRTTLKQCVLWFFIQQLVPCSCLRISCTDILFSVRSERRCKHRSRGGGDQQCRIAGEISRMYSPLPPPPPRPTHHYLPATCFHLILSPDSAPPPGVCPPATIHNHVR